MSVHKGRYSPSTSQSLSFFFFGVGGFFQGVWAFIFGGFVLGVGFVWGFLSGWLVGFVLGSFFLGEGVWV